MSFFAWSGYQRIIKFSEVKIGEEFASSDTGQVFRKEENIFRYNGDKKWELFESDDLVYVGGTLRDTWL